MTGSGCSVMVNPFTEWLMAAPAAWAARPTTAQEDESFIAVSTVVKRVARERGGGKALEFKSNRLAMQGLRHSYSTEKFGIALTLINTTCNCYTTVAMSRFPGLSSFSQIEGCPGCSA